MKSRKKRINTGQKRRTHNEIFISDLEGQIERLSRLLKRRNRTIRLLRGDVSWQKKHAKLEHGCDGFLCYITNIEPSSTPFISSTTTTSTKGMLHEWVTDGLLTPANQKLGWWWRVPYGWWLKFKRVLFHRSRLMSYPTVLGPWFVVQRLKDDRTVSGDFIGMEYYQAQEDGDGLWTLDQGSALLFMSLNQAARVASAEMAHVRVLTSRDEAKEFGRG